jgi:nitroreductase
MTTETNVDSFEAMEKLMLRQRAIRIFDDRPVEDAVIERAIRIATFAPNGGNRQPTRYIVVRDRETKRKMGQIFDELGSVMTGHAPPERTPWEDVPVLVVVVAERNAGIPAAGGAVASVYPAVQNFLLAIQGQGLGSVLTTRWKAREKEIYALIGLPDDWEAHAILPVGWPGRKYGRGNRMPVAEITSRETFGNPW